MKYLLKIILTWRREDCLAPVFKAWLPSCAIVALACILQSACAIPPSGPGRFEAVGFAALPGWSEDRLDAVLPGLLSDCERLTTLPLDQTLGGDAAGDTTRRAGDWVKPCHDLAALDPGDTASLRRVIERDFRPFRLSATATFTGYYEPELDGSLTPSPAFPTPLLRRPRDLVRGPGDAGFGRLVDGKRAPYPTRSEIDAGALDDQHLAFLYLASPIDRFFLQIQGSGRVRLADGSLVRVAFDGQNGRPYVPIGRLMVERGLIPADRVSLQSIRAWLLANPGRADSLMAENPSFVFFRAVRDLAPGIGPAGTIGAPLLPLRSAAVDQHYMPLGSPLFVDTIDPRGGMLRRLVLAQDTGSGIKGPSRVDLFFGWGAEAERLAGRMDQSGTVFVLLPSVP